MRAKFNGVSKLMFIKKSLSLCLVALTFITVIQVPVYAKSTNKNDKPTVKIVSLSKNKINPLKGEKQKIVVSWKKYKVKKQLKVEILNAKKKKVITLFNQKKQKAGKKTLTWNGFLKFSFNGNVPKPGAYYVKASFGNSSVIKKFKVDIPVDSIETTAFTWQIPSNFTLKYFLPVNINKKQGALWSLQANKPHSNGGVSHYDAYDLIEAAGEVDLDNVDIIKDLMRDPKNMNNTEIEKSDIFIGEVPAKRFVVKYIEKMNALKITTICYRFNKDGKNYTHSFSCMSHLKDAEIEKYDIALQAIQMKNPVSPAL